MQSIIITIWSCFVFIGPRAVLPLNAAICEVVNELHDFRDNSLQFRATPNGETDSVEIRVHCAVKTRVPNKAVNLAHVVNSLGTGFNVDAAHISNQIACITCFHALYLDKGLYGCISIEKQSMQPYG